MANISPIFLHTKVIDVHFSDLVVSGELEAGLVVDDFYGSPNPSCPENWKPPAPPVRRI